MSWNHHSEETHGWRQLVYRTYRCSLCRAWAVTVDTTVPPSPCVRCHPESPKPKRRVW